MYMYVNIYINIYISIVRLKLGSSVGDDIFYTELKSGYIIYIYIYIYIYTHIYIYIYIYIYISVLRVSNSAALQVVLFYILNYSWATRVK